MGAGAGNPLESLLLRGGSGAGTTGTDSINRKHGMEGSFWEFWVKFSGVVRLLLAGVKLGSLEMIWNNGESVKG